MRSQSSKHSGTGTLRQRIYGTSILSPLPDQRTVTGCGKARKRDDRLGYTHDLETMSKTAAYHNHITNLEIETREVFEWETWSPEDIQRTLPTDMVTRLDENQLTQSTDSSKHEEMHKPEDNPDPEPPSSDSSETSSSDSRAKKKKSKKKKKRLDK